MISLAFLMMSKNSELVKKACKKVTIHNSIKLYHHCPWKDNKVQKSLCTRHRLIPGRVRSRSTQVRIWSKTDRPNHFVQNSVVRTAKIRMVIYTAPRDRPPLTILHLVNIIISPVSNNNLLGHCFYRRLVYWPRTIDEAARGTWMAQDKGLVLFGLVSRSDWNSSKHCLTDIVCGVLSISRYSILPRINCPFIEPPSVSGPRCLWLIGDNWNRLHVFLRVSSGWWVNDTSLKKVKQGPN